MNANDSCGSHSHLAYTPAYSPVNGGNSPGRHPSPRKRGDETRCGLYIACALQLSFCLRIADLSTHECLIGMPVMTMARCRLSLQGGKGSLNHNPTVFLGIGALVIGSSTAGRRCQCRENEARKLYVHKL